MLDLDGVTCDLPAGSERLSAKPLKIQGFGHVIRLQKSWAGIRKSTLFQTKKGNTLCRPDISPLVFGLVKNLFQNGKSLRPSEIEKIAKFELSKKEPLTTLLIRSE